MQQVHHTKKGLHSRLLALGYSLTAADHLADACDAPSIGAEAVGAAIARHSYNHFPLEGRIRRTVSDAVADGSLTCFEAALVAHDLMNFCGHDCLLMAMNRRDPATGSYLGHAALIYRTSQSLFGAIAVSRHASQAARQARYETEEAVALSYAEGYLRLGLVPISFGLCRLETVGAGLDWRRDCQAMQQLHDRVNATQVNGLEFSELP